MKVMNKKLTAYILIVFMLMFSSISNVWADNEKNPINPEKRKLEIEEGMSKAFQKGGIGEVEKYFEKEGLIKLEGEDNPFIIEQDEISALSAGSDATTSIVAFYDPAMNQYLVYGTWQWNSYSAVDNNPGPADALGLWMTSPSGSAIASDGVAVYDDDGDLRSNVAWREDMNAAGVAWAFSDTWDWLDYVGYKGNIWMWLSKKPTNATYVKVTYQHSYNSGTFSSATISTSGLSATYSGTSTWKNTSYKYMEPTSW